MYYATFHWQMLVNGYSGFFPASYVEFFERMRGFPDARAMNVIDTRGVGYVVVHGEWLKKWRDDPVMLMRQLRRPEAARARVCADRRTARSVCTAWCNRARARSRLRRYGRSTAEGQRASRRSGPGQRRRRRRILQQVLDRRRERVDLVERRVDVRRDAQPLNSVVLDRRR